MNKELFVSSTPHETKVGLVEDDLLAEVYLERENEYTLAGSIYKGRVTRVLPGMQSAFVDIGLERDAFLYVSDFMELEEHDDDLTDVVPANRSVQDLRQQPARAEASPGVVEEPETTDPSEPDLQPESDQEFAEAVEDQGDAQPTVSAGAVPESGDDSQNRERGSWRGRRRRRGGRRDGRSDGRDRAPDRGPERSSDPIADLSRASLVPPSLRPPVHGFRQKPALGPAARIPANPSARRIDFQVPALGAATARAATAECGTRCRRWRV